MNKRGISPLIATVLIIGFTVALAAVVILWGTDFFSGISEKTEVQEEKTRTCAAATVDITEIEQTGPGELSFMLENTGQQDIESITIRIKGNKGTTSIPHLGIASAEKKYYSGLEFDISETGYDISKIEIIPTVEVNKQPTFCAPGLAGEADIPEDTWGATCGNDRLDQLLEDCDENLLGKVEYAPGKQICTDLGFQGGTAGCNLEYCVFDTTKCTGEPLCGNKGRDPDEECDIDKFGRADTGGATCESLGLGGGELYCTDQCEFDTSQCRGKCGNDQVDWFIDREQCDTVDGEPSFYTDIGCRDLGYDAGELGCTDCTIDDSDCYNIDIKKIAAGYRDTCAITNQEELYCWGEGSLGQLGLGPGIVTASSPERVNLDNVKDVSLGLYHSCAVGTVDDVAGMYCWGYNPWGQLGLGSKGDLVYTPTKVPGINNPTAIFAGVYGSCAVEDDELYCWGYDFAKAKAEGTEDYYLVSPTAMAPGLTGITNVVKGSYHTCVIIDNQVQCWGYKGWGNLGNPGAAGTWITDPVEAVGMSSATKLIIGYFHTCAINDNNLYCWGYNYQDHLLLGEGLPQTITTPTQVPGMTAITDVSSGKYFDYTWNEEGTEYTWHHNTCTIKDNKLYCWRSNKYGQLGDGSITEAYPHRADAITESLMTNPIQSTVGQGYTSGHVCATNASGLYCWGQNQYGQLGLGTRTTTAPFSIPTPGKVEFTE